MQVLLVLYEQWTTLNIIYLYDGRLYVVIVIVIVLLYFGCMNRIDHEIEPAKMKSSKILKTTNTTQRYTYNNILLSLHEFYHSS